MLEDRLKVARYISLVASTAVAISCGTNYVYSAYAPQLAEKLHLSATESNLIGTFGNIGMYLSGIPAGMLVDSRGPRLATLLGSIALFVGYYPIYLAFVGGKGSMGVPALCFFAAITGTGSCCAFNAAMKAAALNFPSHRGTATAFPLSAFGLSAFFFSFLSSTFFPGNTSSFLLLLAVGTSSITLISFFFLRVVPVPNAYAAVPPLEPDRNHGNRLHRTKSHDSQARLLREPGTETTTTNTTTASASSPRAAHPPRVQRAEPDETSSILSYSSSSSSSSEDARDYDEEALDPSSRAVAGGVDDAHRGHHIDIRGWALTRTVDFWLLFAMLGLLTGVGLMTINNIGHCAQALWLHYAPTTPPSYIQARQAMHVSILSLFSFSGRMISGILSDHLLHRYRAQRIWMISASGAIFTLAQIFALSISTPTYLFFVSSLSGLAYGMLMGVYPTLVSEVFGLHGLSQKWGTMTVSCVLSGQVFNVFYGKIYDAHSVMLPGGGRECGEGRACYREAYWITLGSSVVGLGLSLWVIRRNRRLERMGAVGGLKGGEGS